MEISYIYALWKNFLGKSPCWYKLTILSFLLINPLIFFIHSYVASWILVLEFIFTLSMALQCYPLLPSGLLAVEAISIGMTTANHVHTEISNNLEVLLLLVFMVTSIYFIETLLLHIFTSILLSIRSKEILSTTFCSVSIFLSAFLDALTVIAVITSVATGFYTVYQKAVKNCSTTIGKCRRKETLEQFRSFLRSLMMHSAMGTALGGMMTMVGEPQNLIIAKSVGWNFKDFFISMLPVSLPVLISGLFTCFLLEKFSLFKYGAKLPKDVKQVLHEHESRISQKRDKSDILCLISQAVIGILLILALAFQCAEVGLIGLAVIILATTFTGITDEHVIGKSFSNSLPFAALLTVFFVIISVIIDQSLFSPITTFIFKTSQHLQLSLFYFFNGLLSSISDNVFVGTVYINEAKDALAKKVITLEQFKFLSVSINAGTNLLSVATPNGQAAFLFLLTSPLAILLRLSYTRMVWMAVPYTVVMTLVGWIGINFLLIPSASLFK